MSSEIIDLEQFFFGSATLGERGQVVIPSDARKACEMHPGDKLLVFRHPMHERMLILARIGEMQELTRQMSQLVENASFLLEQEHANEQHDQTNTVKE